ncbi:MULTISPECIES: receptor-recognizing protein [Enterobacteriaceae]|uniref:receptor-recognizing protein n=1 Tax=Enterobacteriaceae TaxID=543 RepID=UPI000BB5F635|nr:MULTISPECIES: receptor-recognizing protein [Enterobacteriaceae]EFN0061508.1 receptor-recognizing protein [Escherichia coli]EGO4099455.1 receptor-recognizing protein [Escherichia coli]EGO4183760.1 receptor-recognizing protein [Escherichia coli]EIJ0708032.1 receptor-recognizing protein [Escherichia coli]MBY8598545.1 receptor-recognizing protein [Escherichia coli]
MSISNVPGWIGSSAVSETGQRWMSAARTTVQLSAAGNMSQMAGRSKEIYYSIGANHNYNKDTLISYLRSVGSTPVVVTITGDLVSTSSTVPCLDFPGDLSNSYINLVINGGVTIYGRGGNGGSNSAGSAGGAAIKNAIGTRLRITNNGAIAGGGGGGGGGYWDAGFVGAYLVGGGGGRPFGAAGRYSGNGGAAAGAASLTAPGTGSGVNANHGGTGGNVGAAGGACYGNSGNRYGGGAAGAAVMGNAPQWIAVGAIYGSRV